MCVGGVWEGGRLLLFLLGWGVGVFFTFLFIVRQKQLFYFLNVYPSSMLKHMLKVCLIKKY